MRLTIPEPKIELYKDGFAEHDKLNRKDTGDRLSDLVERIDDSLVLALDGAWGSGKSHFLKCWVGEHLKRNDCTTQTVYFDAFQHDFLDDPLIALTSAISERIERQPQSKAARAWQTAKNAAPFLGKAALRLGTAALVGKAISLTDDGDGELNDIGDKMAKESGDISKALIDFWKKEDGKRIAMEAFRTALTEMTEPNEDGKPLRKIVIVIDELDRCRPDYALSILEIIKHFFNVDGVHFILGVNLKELQNSVKSRYGAGIDAERYLRKFIFIDWPLNSVQSDRYRDQNMANYFQYVCDELRIKDADDGSITGMILSEVLVERATLRDIQQICSLMALMLPADRFANPPYRILVNALCIIKVLSPRMFQKISSENYTFEELCEFFLLPDLPDEPPSSEARLLRETIGACLGRVSTDSTMHGVLPRGDEVSGDDPSRYLSQIARAHFMKLRLPLD